MSEARVIQAVKHWVDTFVVGMNLCPFAKRELSNNKVRFVCTKARTEDQLIVALQGELELLEQDPSVETSLLIHPNVLHDFYDYNQFLSAAEALLHALDLEGVYQIASFHPDYQFGGTHPDDAENYTNRAPYPILHLLREASLELAIEGYPGVDKIPARNIDLMNSLGQVKLQALFNRLHTTDE